MANECVDNIKKYLEKKKKAYKIIIKVYIMIVLKVVLLLIDLLLIYFIAVYMDCLYMIVD